jgi:hypothetical protein
VIGCVCALDAGIITTFATVTSVAGAELSASIILILGIAHLFADGLSMVCVGSVVLCFDVFVISLVF